MSEPLVSILMPVYNAEKTLCRAMDSLLNQTYKNIVVVVIDDGCIDGTAAMLKEYALKDNRVKIYSNGENLGVARSLNRGIELCEGKYIARMDADDYSHSDRIKKQVAFMEENTEIDIIGSYRCIIYETHNVIETRPCTNEEIRAHLLFNIFASHPTIMFRAEPFRQNQDWRYPLTSTEDYDLFASLCSKVKFANIPEVLVDYYKSEQQVTTLSAEAIRKANLNTSKNTIKCELGIDTKNMPDSFFGMRGVDPLSYDIADHIRRAAKLFCDMESANERLAKFDTKALSHVLEKEWLHIKNIYHLNSISLSYKDVAESEWKSLVQTALEEDYFEGNVIVYGTGSFSEGFIPTIPNDVPFNIIAYSDSNTAKHGTSFLGKPVIAPSSMSEFNYDYVAISAPIYEDEIREQLITKECIPPEKICSMDKVRDIVFFQKRKEAEIRFMHEQGKQKAYMFCSADYHNIGDHAIAYAEASFFAERLGIKVEEIGVNEYKELSEIVKHHIKKDDFLLITGGGFLGSLYPNTEQMTRKVIREYPDNPIVILPQTLFWENSARAQIEAERTQKVYEAHRNLTICARDPRSYELFNKYYPKCKVILVPDMVLSRKWDDLFSSNAVRKGSLICLKNDKESVMSDKDKNDLFTLGEELCGSAEFINTLHTEYIKRDKRLEFLIPKLNEFCSARLCITDRLHGVIFSAVTGTPCIALGTCNHKLRESTRLIEYLPYIRFAENLNDVERLAHEVLEVESPQFDNEPLSRWFYELETLLKNQYKS